MFSLFDLKKKKKQMMLSHITAQLIHKFITLEEKKQAFA